MKKHFVEFYSPGTFVSEVTEKEIDSWDTAKAIEMSKNIIERHGAKPYGFQFITRSRGDDDLDSKQIDASNMYYLGARVMTLDDVKREMPEKEILIHNMEFNKIEKVIVNDNSYRSVFPLNEDDVILEIK